jgi:hypothetical protein
MHIHFTHYCSLMNMHAALFLCHSLDYLSSHWIQYTAILKGVLTVLEIVKQIVLHGATVQAMLHLFSENDYS